MEEVFIKLLLWFVTLLAIFTLVLIGILLPMQLITEAECLEAGYPESKITYKLDKYCMNLDGTVTVKVEQLNKE